MPPSMVMRAAGRIGKGPAIALAISMITGKYRRSERLRGYCLEVQSAYYQKTMVCMALQNPGTLLVS